MPQMLRTRKFLEAQGYGIGKKILYQDNMSAMLLEKNGKKSRMKNTKHINLRYLLFFSTGLHVPTVCI